MGRRRRVAAGGGDLGAFVDQPDGKIGSTGRDVIADRGPHQAGHAGRGGDEDPLVPHRLQDIGADLEVEANARIARGIANPEDSLRLAGTLGYIQAEFREYFTFIAGRGTVDVTDFRQIQNTPRWTASGTLNYDTPVGSGDLNFNTTVSYRSKTYQFEVPTPVFGFDQPGYALWDASLVYRAAGGRWSIGLHGKNLLDERYVTSGYNFLLVDPVTGVPVRNAQGNLQPALGREGTLTAFYGNPRQVFLTLTFSLR